MPKPTPTIPRKKPNSTAFGYQLREALHALAERPRLCERAFFVEWFRKRGQAIFFLFRKNLSVTNIQFAELLSLVRTHLYVKETKRRFSNQQILSLEGFLQGVKSMFEVHQSVDEVIRFHSATLQRTVLAEPFYGSCTIFVPPHLTLDYKQVCAESGYIHSVGINLHTRLLDDTSVEEITVDLRRYLERGNTCTLPGRILFRPFASEDFSPYDREQHAELKQGLDDVKLHLEKYHIGGVRLVSAIRQLQRRFRRRLVFPGPGPFMKDAEIAGQQRDRSQTIWLLADKGIAERGISPGRERFLICYAQLYKNENPFAYFDENKPAWNCHTTLPHSLAAAMLNITRPWQAKKLNLALDPFCGSGTVWLESLRFPSLDLRGADIDPVSRLLAEDNLWFFSRNTSELEDIIKYFDNIVTTAKASLFPAPQRLSKPHDYLRARSVYLKIFGNDRESSKRFTQQHVNQLKTIGRFVRMLFYVALRVRYRHFAGFLRHEHRADPDEIWAAAFIHELDVMQSQIRRFQESRELEERAQITARGQRYSEFSGSYSRSVALSARYLRRCYDSRLSTRRIVRRTATTRSTRHYHVIVTDPPYGINTTDDPKTLGGVYAKAIPALLRSLNDGGHLVICLPEVSYTGKKLPAFTQRALVTYQVLSTADVLEKEVVVEGRLLPRPTRVFTPPYYWESERALRRVILHFRFRNKGK